MMIHGVGFSYNCLLCLLLLQFVQIGVNACGFKCGDGGCIDLSDLCDGQKDCTDGSDETREVCALWPCRNAIGLEELVAQQNFGLGDDDLSFISSFRCEYGGCITNNFKCNGISNCADGSDETAEVCKDINCTANSFRCDYGACISRYDVCDNVENCRDGSDEKPENCKFRATVRRVVCPKRTKKYCDNRRGCYERRQECDGKFDCADKSDEKKELCNRADIVVTPPPPTTSRTPPVVFPGPEAVAGCLHPNCRCPMPELNHFCLPCGEIADLNDTCLSLGEKAVCSVSVTKSVSVDVLSCGVQEHMTTAQFSRVARSCVDPLGMVPVMTLVYADCWGVSSAIMRCHKDGYWRVPGAQRTGSADFDSYDSIMEKQPMKQLCQPYFVNAQVCGKKSRYRSSGGKVHLENNPHLENRWPMVMGLLKKRDRYECSATLISPQFLLTAAHCVVSSLESRDQAMDIRHLKVERYDGADLWVSEIFLHPAYKLTPTLLNDLALIRLEENLIFNNKFYPACVDLNDGVPLPTYKAVVFDRANGENKFIYNVTMQHIDTSCFTRTTGCNRLEITETQFCGFDPEYMNHLAGGSSGGPFLQNFGSDDSDKWTVSGVVSYSDREHTCPQHTVFTATKTYKAWIADIVHNEI